MQHNGYLPHIDGLRAIAIALVVLFHAGFSFVPGGFVGVDLFFVISGFLITGQIYQQMQQGKFSFQGFYLRRFRRLLPAFIAVAVTTLVVGYFLLLPEDYIYHAKLTALAFFSVANFYLENTTEGYFATESDEIPMLHMWSLAVEEQFYLVWPLMLLLLFRRFRDGKLLGLLFTLWIASFLLSHWQAAHAKSVAYYLLPARFFELLAGGILAITINRLPTPGKVAASAASLLGLALVIGSALLLSRGDLFPGINALPITLGTVLLIYAGNHCLVAGRVLASAPFVGLGKISYSLYLWHWPLFAFIAYEAGELTPQVAMGAIVLSVVVSAACWQFVENPFRFRWKFTFPRTFTAMYLVPGLLFGLFVLFLNKTEGFPQRFGVDIAIVEAMGSKPMIYREECNRESEPSCRQILLIGDSHAGHISPFIHALIEESGDKNLKLNTLWKPFCPPVSQVFRAAIDKNSGEKTFYFDDNSCYRMVNGFYEGLTDRQYHYVVLGDFWSKYGIKQEFLVTREVQELSVDNSNAILREALYRSLREIIAHDITPVIVKDNAAIAKPLLKCSFKKVLKADFPESCEITAAEVDRQQQYALQLFADIERDFPRVRFIDLRKVMCDSKSCKTTLDGMPVYRDKNHITDPAARMLGRKYLREVGNPFEPVSAAATPADPAASP